MYRHNVERKRHAIGVVVVHGELDRTPVVERFAAAIAFIV
jgi:hypothetical protein